MKAISLVIVWLLFIAAVPLHGIPPCPLHSDTARFYDRHSFDVVKYKLDIGLYQCFYSPYPRNFQAQEVISLKADSALSSIWLNAAHASLVIDSVSLAGVSFNQVNDTLTILLNRTYQPGEMLDVGIFYRHNNVTDHGFYAYYGAVFTDSPPEGARKWLPSWDRPSDKALWELTARVPLSARLGSTGLLADSTISGDTISYHWKTNIPVSTYLITLTARLNWLVHKKYWHKLTNADDSIPIVGYYRTGENMTIFDSVIGPVTTFYARLFGDYPFEKIGFATLNNAFPWGGMENQTMVNLMTGGYNNEDLIVHEHSHQWFGDLITCGTWADIWLNEGFATYCQNLWVEHIEGTETYKNSMNGLANNYLSANRHWPLYKASWAKHTPTADSLYNVAITYNKGACVLFQLRYVLGDSLFFKAMHEYATDASLIYGNALTSDFAAKVNQAAGENMDWFFNEWVYAPDHPVYENTFGIDSLSSNSWKVTFITNQTQENTVFFKMPLELLVTFSDATDTLIRVMNDTNHQAYAFLFPKKPENLTFDPSRNILLKQASTIIGIKKTSGITGFKLYQNSPNPFSNRTTIMYDVELPGNVKISVIDSKGKLWNCPVNRHHEPGFYRYELSDSEFVPGTYFVSMETGNFRETKKMVVIK
jgi:aminopeptidase N